LEEVKEVVSEAADPSQLAALREKLEALMRLTDRTVDTVRRIASELRPVALDDLGLVEAIEWQARQFKERTGMKTNAELTHYAIQNKLVD
jgi:signal transduction histidine kinase